jgi:hypothetical protein
VSEQEYALNDAHDAHFKGTSECMLYSRVHQLAHSRALLLNGVILSEEIVSHERVVARIMQAIGDDYLTCYAERHATKHDCVA